LFLGCVAFFAATNLLMFPSIFFAGQPTDVVAILMGVCLYSSIGAQMALLAIWCMLVPLHWVKRSLLGATSCLVLYGLLIAGFVIFYAFEIGFIDDELWTLSLIGLLWLPLLLLAVQTPLWIMHVWFRWHIVHRDDGPYASFQPLRIGGLMIAMAAVAMALAAVLAAERLAQSINEPFDKMIIVFVASIIMVASATIVLPAVVATLRARRLLMSVGLVLAVNTAIAIGCAALMVILAGAPADWETLIAMPAIHGGVFAGLAVPMLIARKLGYRLQWGRQ